MSRRPRVRPKRLPEELDTLGKRIRYVRLCRRYRMEIWCKYTRFNRHSFIGWEDGTRGISHENLRKVAYFLQVPIMWLVTGEGDPPVQPMTKAQQLMSCVDLTPAGRLHKLNVNKPKWRDMPEVE